MEAFETCAEINNLLLSRNELAARNLLIQLLAALDHAEVAYPQIVNQMIRETGLFPYMQLATASWDQKYVHRAFQVDVGRRFATLHREQSSVLAKLLDGKSIAVSAPTSFGKSFVIDAFIAAKDPDNVVIIVPTIALMDETRRRIFKKFGDIYEIITAPDMNLGRKNILIFPQERAFRYASALANIDLLVIDEFYKASRLHDRERAPSLIKAILKLSKKADQRYYLAPNIKKLGDNPLTKDMEFLELLDFNTVYLSINELYKEIDGDIEKKSQALIRLIKANVGKTLIYAGTYSEIDKVSRAIIEHIPVVERMHTSHFAKWLRENYQVDWQLADLVDRGIAVHNGRMHRCLSQLQVKIFEYADGFDSIVSTSSIIEGVNTSAQNVVIWRSKLGSNNLKDFTYKNIIGRAGRMFKYFVGNIYLLDKPPASEDTQLNIDFPDEILGSLDLDDEVTRLTDSQIGRIIEYREIMSELIGDDNFRKIQSENLLQDSDSDFLLILAMDMSKNPEDWRGFGFLNSENPNDWDRMLYKVLRLKSAGWETSFEKIVETTKALSRNWTMPLPELILSLKRYDISVDEFFKLERTITFKLSALLNDVNVLHKIIVNPSIDISSFVSRLSHAFLPAAVYHLEEYGLPRMITKKIHAARMINFLDRELGLSSVIHKFRSIGLEAILHTSDLGPFDRYVVKFFFDGITPDAREDESTLES